MKIIAKIKTKFKKNKITEYVKKKVWNPRYWYAHYYKKEAVQEKTMLYQAFQSNIMAGNPYAIFCELIKRPEYKDYTHIWVYRTDKSLKDDTFERFKGFPNVVYVKIGTKEYCKYLASCQFLIANATLPPYWIKKDGQTYVNTWHGVPLKTLGRDEQKPNPNAVRNCQRNFYQCDYIVMPNIYTAEKISFAYNLTGLMPGKIICTGYPRTDLAMNTNKDYIKEILALKLGESLNNKKIVLYAPTFRSQGTVYKNMSAELARYMKAMMKILPENYILVFKAHNRMSSFFKKDKKMRSHLIFDEIETNELLSVTDVLITDYSSIFFDFLCTKRPILFFDYDKQEYENDRGLYLSLDELPGAVCENVEELEENFRKIEESSYDYSEKYERFLKDFAYNDDGRASKRAVDIIFGQSSEIARYLYQPDKENERILVVGKMGGSYENKGECIRTLREFDAEKNTLALMAPYALSYSDDFCEELKNIRLISIEPIFLYTFLEKVYQKLFHRMPKDDEFYSRQYKCYFGGVRFSRIIDLNGENSPWKKVFENNCNEYELCPKISIPEEKVKNREAVGRKMTVLFLATFDSVNYVYVNLIRELQKRNYDVILLVKNVNDEINNRMFSENGIPFIDVTEYKFKNLGKVDFVICSPFKSVKFNRLMNEINKRGIFCVGFTNLFSSILMRPYTDIVFSVGTSKFLEFEENGLHYNMVAVGNPQYDSLTESFENPKITDMKNIKRILFIDQGGYPFGTEGKKLLGEIILAMARNHPDKSFVVKPRYLPDDIAGGSILHRPSEHLYDFIPNPPKNLILLKGATILEDIIADYDAVVTMWSTSYLDAAMRGMPVMLISRLPSEEVMDVRVQRIQEAYDRLEKTGCVVDYKEILEGKLEFHYVNEEYLKEETENVGRPCAPSIVDILEDIYKYWIVYGLRPYEVFQMNGKEFREKLPEIGTVKAKSLAYRRRRSFLRWFNERMQDLSFLNRAMAKPFNLEPLKKYWYFFPPKKFKKNKRKRLEFKVKLTTETVKMKYFRPQTLKTETDPIRLDYYFDRLFRRKKYRQIKNCKNIHVYPETRAFYMSMIYLKKGRYDDAAKEFADYCHITEALNVKPIAKDRHINYDFISNGQEAENFFKALFARKEYGILKDMGKSKHFNIGLRKKYLTKILRAEKPTI
ncbi:MAG: hypothetical protein HDT48_00645 [Ruminococcaceae bacterium]|nr:hypothetical protein [Oscillospiraceae bacterium]